MMKCEQGSLSDCGKDLCCWSCEEREACPDACNSFKSAHEAAVNCVDVVTEENALATFNSRAVSVIQAMVDLLKQKKELEEKEEAVRQQLTAAMEMHGITCFENDSLKVTFKKASVRSGVDTKALKENFPEVYKACKKDTPVKASISISLKK